mmetsp:Transcript_584/g.845  ORF Transcript_584/g.845 Transcript_584/m.845 type:complete len:122 (+) Transcript_584:843-1208(+)
MLTILSLSRNRQVQLHYPKNIMSVSRQCTRLVDQVLLAIAMILKEQASAAVCSISKRYLFCVSSNRSSVFFCLPTFLNAQNQRNFKKPSSDAYNSYFFSNAVQACSGEKRRIQTEEVFLYR